MKLAKPEIRKYEGKKFKLKDQVLHFKSLSIQHTFGDYEMPKPKEESTAFLFHFRKIVFHASFGSRGETNIEFVGH